MKQTSSGFTAATNIDHELFLWQQPSLSQAFPSIPARFDALGPVSDIFLGPNCLFAFEAKSLNTDIQTSFSHPRVERVQTKIAATQAYQVKQQIKSAKSASRLTKSAKSFKPRSNSLQKQTRKSMQTLQYDQPQTQKFTSIDLETIPQSTIKVAAKRKPLRVVQPRHTAAAQRWKPSEANELIERQKKQIEELQ